MNCKFCGDEMEPNQTVCPGCGVEQEPEETPAEEVAPVVEEAPELPNYEKPMTDTPTNRKPLLIASIIGALVLIGVVLFVILKPASTAVETEPAQEALLTQEAATPNGTEDAFTSEITLAMVDQDGAFIPHDFLVADEVLTEEMANAVVATVGDFSMTNVTLNYYYYQQYMDLYNQYGYYITMLLDPTQSLATQMLSDTQSIQDMLVQSAVYAYQQETALYSAAMAEGYVMPQEYQDYCDSLPDLITADVQSQGYATAEEYLMDFYGPYATMDSFLEYVTTSMVASAYMSEKTEGLTNTEEEILAYYDANAEMYAYYGVSKDTVLVDVRHVLTIPVDDGNSTTDEYGAVVYSDESWAAAKAEAEDLLAQWEAGDATEDSFAALATEYTQDPGSAAAGGLYTDVYQGQMVDTFDAWCFDASRVYGDYGMVETTYGYHLMYFVGTKEDTSWYDTAASDLLAEQQIAVQESYVSQWDFAVNYNNAVLSPSQLEVELAAYYAS